MTSPKDKVNALNNYFTSISTLNDEVFQILIPSHLAKCPDIVITEQEVTDLVLNISKFPGPYELLPNFLFFVIFQKHLIVYGKVLHLTLFFINDIENEALNDIKMFADDTSLYCVDHIGGVMVSLLASSVVDRGFKPRLGHTKDYKIGMCCFSAKHTVLRRKSKNWLARNRNNVSEWSNISTR